MKVESDLITLAEIEEKRLRFAVPIYQRLYVWGEDQVKTLMEDLLSAFEEKRELVFLGGTLVMERLTQDGEERVLELIDGQQRFTTLWLISLIWRHQLETFLSVQSGDRLRPRLHFDIREEVNCFLHDRFNRLAENAADFGSDGEGTDAIQTALARIRSFLDDQERVIDPAGFTAFVRNKVKLVLTRVPAQTDLNKLFEVINNRGVQLQHHEILKAWMLNALDPDDRSRYACLWDACAGMEDYVERNLRELTGIGLAELFTGDASATDSEPLAKAAKILEVLARRNEQPEETAPLSLAAILAGAYSFEPSAGNTNGATEHESDKVRSICGFPMFLQHVLRIWLHRHNRPDIPRILDKELLRLFTDHFFAQTAQPELAANVRSFIELLWEQRYIFDKHIIKWVNRGEEEQHLILKPRLNTSGNLSRDTEEPESIREFSLLQSMLYHSQQITTQYWMTPLLAYMHKGMREGSGSVVKYASFLRHLDNHMLCTEEARPLIERSREFLENPRRQNKLTCEILKESLGTGFPHYWFYKLEFVLWFYERDKQGRLWKEFRFTAKNSVEHISPQNPQGVDLHKVVDATVRNGFGNLALVSRSVNSTFGNLPFTEKRERFKSRNRERLDSLKLALVYENAHWSDAMALEHRDAMISSIKRYLGQI